MNRRLFMTYWCRWLRAAGIPAAHVAIVLDVEPLDVETMLASQTSRRPPAFPIWGKRKHDLFSRSVRAEMGSKIRRFAELGYDAKDVALALCLERREVESYLKRTTPARKIGTVRPGPQRSKSKSTPTGAVEPRPRRSLPIRPLGHDVTLGSMMLITRRRPRRSIQRRTTTRPTSWSPPSSPPLPRVNGTGRPIRELSTGNAMGTRN